MDTMMETLQAAVSEAPKHARSETAVFIERRTSATDRRSGRAGSLKWFLKPGRRRHVRRKSDRRRIHLLDFYQPEMFYFLVATLLLSCLDALLTLWLLDHGAMEINPVMAYYIEKGPMVFMGIKYYLTAAIVFFAVLINYAYIRFIGIRFEHILKFSTACFACVVIWELFLIVNFVI